LKGFAGFVYDDGLTLTVNNLPTMAIDTTSLDSQGILIIFPVSVLFEVSE
jgi:hypothetical protein